MKKSKFAQIDKEHRGANVDATVREVNKKAKIYVIIAIIIDETISEILTKAINI